MENKRSKTEFQQSNNYNNGGDINESNSGHSAAGNVVMSERERRTNSRANVREEKAALLKAQQDQEEAELKAELKRKRKLDEEKEAEKLGKMRARRQEKEYKINEQFLVLEKLENNPFVALYIHEYGRLSCPVAPQILPDLKKVMVKSSHGLSKNGQTFDEETPLSWELQPKKFNIAYPKIWTDFVNNTILASVVEKLGLGHKPIIAKLDKFIIYETGSFFEQHMDHEKDVGNFGSLVIDLPSVYTGGLESWEYKTEIKTNSDIEQSTGAYYVFYNIVDHGMSQITFGLKSSLIYQLINTDKERERENQRKYPPKHPWVERYGPAHAAFLFQKHFHR